MRASGQHPTAYFAMIFSAALNRIKWEQEKTGFPVYLLPETDNYPPLKNPIRLCPALTLDLGEFPAKRERLQALCNLRPVHHQM
jgi:hypothetical protein